jgi:hypothetical protein
MQKFRMFFMRDPSFLRSREGTKKTQGQGGGF